MQKEENKKDFFKQIQQEENLVGYLYELDYNRANVLVNDDFKIRVRGIAHGCFLMAIHDDNKESGILLRVLDAAEIPQKKIIVESITDAHISQKTTPEKEHAPDDYTKNFYKFNGLTCRILGTFYYNENKKLCFGADIDNFLGAYNYQVYKPQNKELEIIINQNIKTKQTEVIGHLHYSSTQSFKNSDRVEVLLKIEDIIAKRSAFFGMTRTGKSNTMKIIIEAINSLNTKREKNKKIGQIIFDVNGEYTFINQQDEGSIHDKLKENTVCFSANRTKVKDDIKPILYNFYDDDTLEQSFEILCNGLLTKENSHYFYEFANVKLNTDEKKAMYKCILYKAGFESLDNYKLKIKTEEYTLKQAVKHFETNSSSIDDIDYQALKNILKPEQANRSGYKALIQFKEMHSVNGNTNNKEDYKNDINSKLREGKIVLIDLSTVSSTIQQVYIDSLCAYIFQESLNEFTKGEIPKFIQMYFEEAHIIFTSYDLDNIYNRIAKESAKLNIGISYSTQEVSSISPSILKNTQNWFISHLNNTDEIKILDKYYDFKDFSQSIIKNSDVGFARVKTFSNNYTIPVKIKKFEAEKKSKGQIDGIC